MGQYYLVVNIDKEEYLHAHCFGDGLKLREFGFSAMGTLTALAVLLADGNGRGFGDLGSKNPIIGSWAGDRIVIAGDEADKGKFANDPKRNLYDVARDDFQNVSRLVLRAMAEDTYLADVLRRNQTVHGKASRSVFDYAMSED